MRYDPDRARSLLLKSFRSEESFPTALARIEEEMEPTELEREALQALWIIWELYGDDGTEA